MFAISVPLVLIIGDTRGTEKGVLKDLSQQRKKHKENGKQLSMKLINSVDTKILALFFHFCPMIHMRCVVNYNHSKAYSNERARMFEASWSWLPLATILNGLRCGAFNNCDQGPMK